MTEATSLERVRSVALDVSVDYGLHNEATTYMDPVVAVEFAEATSLLTVRCLAPAKSFHFVYVSAIVT
jgi:hypothetical protein